MCDNENPTFTHLVGIIFNNWTGLKMALEHGMGGSADTSLKKVIMMVDTVSELCLNGRTEWEAVVDFLDEVMYSQFDTILEDESSSQVGQQVWQLSHLWHSGNQQEISSIISSLPVTVPIQTHIQHFNYGSLPSFKTTADAEIDMESTLQEESDISEGWTVVKRKKL